ncbi:MAG: adenylyl-sulfate kinase, partial [Acetobacteraceae bacterium]|nr:adenylyl-sulfate kinase [Acetobacteraceae bacterium]
LDGLLAEREQGITIDVAYRYFSTARRSFIVADAPGHEQYTRNMATGASTADLAVILIDARKGVLPQTRRHAFIVATLGVRHAVLAINKMDLVGFSPSVWQQIVDEFRATARSLGFQSIVPIPICARDGDNVATRSERMPWFTGPALLEHLETVSIAPPVAGGGGCLPVQLVIRPDAEFRGYAGTVARGTLRAGQTVIALPSLQRATIARIVTGDGDLSVAAPGQAVTVTLTGEIDVSRGDVLAAADDPPEVTSRVCARLLWMEKEPLASGQTLAVQLGRASANACVARIRHAIDVQTYEPWPAAWLAMNEIGLVDLVFDKPLVATTYAEDRTLGALILVNRLTSQTAGMATIQELGEKAPSNPKKWTGAFGSRRIRVRVLGAAVIWMLAAALSHNLGLASVLAVAELVIHPVLDQMVEANE